MDTSTSSSKVSRRQSMPETMLAGAHSGSLYQQSVEKTENCLGNNEGHQEGDMESLSFAHSGVFKRSETGRFSKSKRKSQSLYQPTQARGGSSQVNMELNKNHISKSGSVEVSNTGMSSNQNSVNLGGNPVENGPKSEGFSSANHYLLEEKRAKPEERHEVDGDLDFLLSIPKHSFPNQNIEREQKREANADVDVAMFSRNGPASFVNGSRKVRRSLHEARGVEPMFPTFEPHFNAMDDPTTHSHAVSSLPALATTYDKLQTFNPLNNLHPFQLNTGAMNAFQVNPLNNFGMNGMGYEQYGNYGHLGIDTGAEIKKRRSRVPSSVYRGVSRCGKDNKFQARIRVHGKVKYLGRFKSEVEAAKCYDKHAIEYLGVNAQTNFPYVPPQTSSG